MQYFKSSWSKILWSAALVIYLLHRNSIRKWTSFTISKMEITNPYKLLFPSFFWTVSPPDGQRKSVIFPLRDAWGLRQVFPSKRKKNKATYMLSQNLVRVLGFSWLRLCRNQRWMLLTSQSSCLERPSNLFSSGCCEIRHQEKHFQSIFIFTINRSVLLSEVF
jgi:hypothetical protein